MKFVLILFVLIGITQAEDCTTTADCRHVTCPELDYILACDRTECSCLKKCSLRSDCQTTPHGPHNHCTHGLHCVDGSCKCGAY